MLTKTRPMLSMLSAPYVVYRAAGKLNTKNINKGHATMTGMTKILDDIKCQKYKTQSMDRKSERKIQTSFSSDMHDGSDTARVGDIRSPSLRWSILLMFPKGWHRLHEQRISACCSCRVASL